MRAGEFGRWGGWAAVLRMRCERAKGSCVVKRTVVLVCVDQGRMGCGEDWEGCRRRCVSMVLMGVKARSGRCVMCIMLSV